jgi:effector-binding domain-containing protein
MDTLTVTGYEAAVKTVEPVTVVSVNGVVPNIAQMGDTFDRLFGVLEEYIALNGRRVGPPMAIYHDSGTGPSMFNMRVELAIPFEGSAPRIEGGQVRVYEMPRIGQVAYVLHRGTFETIGRAYDALIEWIRDNGYVVIGPDREIYLSCGDSRESCLTEVQLAVVR